MRFPGRFDSEGNASVGLAALPADHPLAIQGPGAGAEVTVAALFDDALKIAFGMTRRKHVC